MNANGIGALIAAAVLAFAVRMFNVIVEWVARVLGVTKPDPITDPLEAARKPTTGPDGPTGPGTP